MTSNRTLIEIDHDLAPRIFDNPKTFAFWLSGLLCGGPSDAVRDSAKPFGIRVLDAGLVIVPRDPTEAMCGAAGRIEVPSGDGWHTTSLEPSEATEIWRAMIAAALES